MFGVDVLQGLEAWGVRTAKVDMRAAHAKRCSARGPALVEDEDLGVCVALPLQGEQGQEHGLARAGGTDDKRMTNIANVEI